MMHPLVVLAAVAHPDDIEFMMAGTLRLLQGAGAEIHMWNLADGRCGSKDLAREEIAPVRAEEARASARLMGATHHAPLFEDMGIFYDRPSLARTAAVLREIRPSIILTHSPQDYMEDHVATCRLVVSAAFVRGMTNFATDPVRLPWDAPVTLYHALPHGLHDDLGRPVRPDLCIDIGGVVAIKREMLAQHRSQREWLAASQGMDAYLEEMEGMAREVGRRYAGCELAEGWLRHNHLGFTTVDADPLSTLCAGAYHAPSPQ
jgi:LmbE family N-acetylglucosaminyl deacetylase